MTNTSDRHEFLIHIRKTRMRTGALAGIFLFASLTGIIFFAYQLFGLPFIPFDFFDWMTRVLPGPVITFGIDLMIDLFRVLGMNVASTSKSAEQFIAVTQFLVIGILAATIFFGIMGRQNKKSDFIAGIVTGLLVGLPFIAISIAVGQSPVSPLVQIIWLFLLFVLWGLALGKVYNRLVLNETYTLPGKEEDLSLMKGGRRKFLYRLSGITAAITLLGSFAGSVLSGSRKRAMENELNDTKAHRSETGEGMPFPNMNDPVMPAPGTRPEYTPIKNHYKVFIRTKPTVIDVASWILPITGMVDNSLMLTLDDLKKKYKSRSHYVTLSCISGRIGTSLIGTTLWTGVSLQDILAEARVKQGARYLFITSGDGFYESVALESIASDERIMLCYAWDGHDLPVDHGFPLRIWIPDRYGMKQPKWITGIEVTDEYRKGYWVERSWDEEARVKTTSVIDTVAVDAMYANGDQKMIPVGGIAFSGARGISKVEIRIDGGPWRQARLRSPLSETTWVIWRYDWPVEKGEHIIEVRCAEADGTPQIERKQSNRPSGATGIHSYKVTI